MRLILYCLFILISLWELNAQKENLPEHIFSNAIELRHDNDFPVFTDRYYTTGNFVGWHRLLSNENDSLEKKQYRLFLVQQLYTPADILETNTKRFDRPFAGYLGLSNGLSIANANRILDFEITIGISGPYSGGSAIQEAFHSSPAVSSRIPTWLGQIKTAAFGNLFAKYTREWQWQPNPFSVHVAVVPNVSLGNRDIFAEQEVAFFFGRRASLLNSSAYQHLGNTSKELFFAVRLAYRYIFHNALLEGDLLGDSSLVLIEPYRNQFIYKLDMNARLKRYNLKLAYNFATPLTRRTYPHLYVTIGITRVF